MEPRKIKLLGQFRAPKSIHKFVLELIAKIGSNKEPRWVPLQPQGGRANNCFFNVPEHIEKNGGSVQYGWTIWQLANLLIEGEFHAVWVSPLEEWIDVTPKVDKESEILFVPDEKNIYQGVPVNSFRMPIIDAPEARRFIKTSNEEFEFKKRNSVVVNGVSYFTGTPSELKRFESERHRLCLEMAKYIPSDLKRCPCTSGLAFGDCCGRV
jgi:hypothetical protein